MATLTPGVLWRLLQSMNTDTKATGEHRRAVLQVIGIFPALSAGGGSELCPSHGFYLQLSDSANSTYVSLSSDADSILLSLPQLGQLVHVDRLHFALPVPRASGLRPIPSSRPHPFLGSPEPLVARSSPTHHGFVIQPASSSDAGPPLLSINRDEKPGNRTIFAAKENIAGPVKNSGDSVPKRRFSSPARAKFPDRKVQRDPSPAPAGVLGKSNSRPSSPVLGGRAASRASSPVPSKCAVLSLVAAKEENRRVAREPAIVVPSRYWQPSPVGLKAAGTSSMGRRGSVSPGGRRLSGGLKVWPAAGGECGGRKKVESGRSVRKSLEEPRSNSLESKEKGGLKSKVDHQAILRTQVMEIVHLVLVSDFGFYDFFLWIVLMHNICVYVRWLIVL